MGLVTALDGSGNFPPTGLISPDNPGRSGHPGHGEGYDIDICLEALRNTTKICNKNRPRSLGDYNRTLLNNSVEALTP